MDDTPFIAVGNDELGPDLGAYINCNCGARHEVHCSSSHPDNATASVTLQFYKCGDKTYLCGINKQELARRD